MPATQWMTFPALDRLTGFHHRFTLRNPEIDVNEHRELVIERLWGWHIEHVVAMGFGRASLRTAEQVHGNQIAVVGQDSSSEAAAACDGLVSDQRGITLGIYVADCCAVFLVDPVTGAFGVVHSGRKGTEGRIIVRAIDLMEERYGASPEHIVVQLSPCIRPPAYEIDFAADIRQQALDAGIRYENLHDAGICTSSDLSRFYSYRVEKGRTGRMLALLGRSE